MYNYQHFMLIIFFFSTNLYSISKYLSYLVLYFMAGVMANKNHIILYNHNIYWIMNIIKYEIFFNLFSYFCILLFLLNKEIVLISFLLNLSNYYILIQYCLIHLLFSKSHQNSYIKFTFR